jgi:glycosyltransferase involved in cell wall biosynthesis
VNPKNGNFVQQHALAVSKHCNVTTLHILAVEQNNDFEVVTNNNEGILETTVYYKKIKGSSPIHQLKKLKRRNSAYNLGYETILKQFQRIDITHLNVTYPAGIFALQLKKKYNIPYIITEHWTAFLPSTNYTFGTAEKKYISKIIKGAELVCPVSNNLVANMQELGYRNNYQAVPNVVDTEVFSYSPKPTDTKTRFLHISHLRDEHKNISGILEAFQQVAKNNTTVSLTIAGDGDVAYWATKIEALNLPTGQLTLLGAQSSKEVASLMATHDYFILFSNYENLPCVISESLVVGRPVISSNVGGVREMIDENSGILVQAGNTKELVQAIEKGIDNKKHYNLSQISEDATKRYSYEQVGKQFETIYQNILKANG